MATTNQLNVLTEPEEACTTCVCNTPAPPECDHTTPCFPIYPETTSQTTPQQAELELLCGVER